MRGWSSMRFRWLRRQWWQWWKWWPSLLNFPYLKDIVMMVLIPSADKTSGWKFSLDFKDFNRNVCFTRFSLQDWNPNQAAWLAKLNLSRGKTETAQIENFQVPSTDSRRSSPGGKSPKSPAGRGAQKAQTSKWGSDVDWVLAGRKTD